MRTEAKRRGAAPRYQGFTLLEMLVVLVIIGLLAGLVGPRLLGKVDDSKVRTAETQVKMIKGALETFKLDVGRLPTSKEGLDALWNPPQDEQGKALWRGPYLDEAVPADPWGNPYRYEVLDNRQRPYALFSLGADGRPGGQDIDADIGYLKPE